jgi:hypothetical protein
VEGETAVRIGPESSGPVLTGVMSMARPAATALRGGLLLPLFRASGAG